MLSVAPEKRAFQLVGIMDGETRIFVGLPLDAPERGLRKSEIVLQGPPVIKLGREKRFLAFFCQCGHHIAITGRSCIAFVLWSAERASRKDTASLLLQQKFIKKSLLFSCKCTSNSFQAMALRATMELGKELLELNPQV